MVYFGISALLIFPLCFVNSSLATRLRRQTFKDTHYIDESDFIKAVMCTECHSDPRCNGVRDYLICANKCYDKQTPNVEVNSCSNLFECQDHCSYNPHYIPGPNECDRVFDCLDCVMENPLCGLSQRTPTCLVHGRPFALEVQRPGSPDELMLRTWTCSKCDQDDRCAPFMPVIHCVRNNCPVPTDVNYKSCSIFGSCYDWCYSLRNLVKEGEPPKCGMDSIRCLICVKEKCATPSIPSPCFYHF